MVRGIDCGINFDVFHENAIFLFLILMKMIKIWYF